MLKLYNTLSRKLEDFAPLHPPSVGLYTCGPTVYSTAHLGNLRTYIFEDVLKRVLRLDGFEVKHVMNITDVGHLTGDGDMGKDRMEESAKREQRSAWEIASQYETEFFADLAKLNVIRPDVVLRATETIDLQIELIQQLEAKGFTYQTSDGLYFDTSKFKAYGQLSGQKASEKHAGARVEVNPEKKNPTDFALWKFSKPEEKRQMEWPSPWGTGFPGWHIECSAMSMKELGDQFDIHCGGIDHIAVHHENEIAQSEAASGKHPFVKYWMHGEFLVLPEKRMGKSEGNAILMNDLLEKGFHPLDFRYLTLQTHYRQKLNFSWEALKGAAQARQRLGLALLEHKTEGVPEDQLSESHWTAFSKALNEDLNTAKALAVVHDLIGSGIAPQLILHTAQKMDEVLALGLSSIELPAWTKPTDELQGLLQKRTDARANKDWAQADAVRQQIAELGYEVVDTSDGPRLRKI